MSIPMRPLNLRFEFASPFVPHSFAGWTHGIGETCENLTTRVWRPTRERAHAWRCIESSRTILYASLQKCYNIDNTYIVDKEAP